MVFPVVPVITIASLFAALKSIIHFKIRPYTDKLILVKIREVKENLQNSIIDFAKDYYNGFYVTVAIDFSIIFLAFVIYYFLHISMISLSIFSLSIIIITIRFIFDIAQKIKSIMPYFPQLKSFLQDAIQFKSLGIAINRIISKQFLAFYYENTTSHMRDVHYFASSIGIIKSPYSIELDVIRALSSITKEKEVKKTVYPAVFLALFYGTFAFLAKLFVFSFTVKMNTIELVLYPFKVILPYFINLG